MSFAVNRTGSGDWQKLNSLILLIATLVAAAAAIIIIISMVMQEVRSSSRGDADLNAASDILTKHVYNYDIQAVRSVGAAMMARDYVKRVEVYGAQNNLLYRSDAPMEGSAFESEYPLVTQEGGAGPQVIGVMRVWRKETAWHTIFGVAAIAALTTFVLVFLPSYLAVQYYISRFVLRPLEQLSIAIDKTLESGRPAKTNYEDATHLGRFSNQFDTMQEKLVEVQAELSEQSQVVSEQAEVLAQILVASDRGVLYFKDGGPVRRYNQAPAADRLFIAIPTDRKPSRSATAMRDAIRAASPAIRDVTILDRVSQPNGNADAKTLYELEIWGPGDLIREVTAADLGHDHLALIISDVTQLRQMEIETIQARKVESLGALTGGVAHDLNNMLAVITGNLQLIERAYENDPPLIAKVKSALRASNDGAGIVRTLLNFSRQDAERGAVMDVTQTIREIAPMLRSGLDPRIHMTIRIEDGLSIRAAQSEFTTALLNLVVNARDAMPEGGHVTLHAFKTFPGDETGEEETIAITVSDTGSGIPPALLDKIGDPFFTTKPASKGTGMGLALVHAFVRRFGGKLQYWNNVDRGATFRLTFPACTSAAEAREAPLLQQARGADRHGRVLVVDDETALSALVKEFIERPGLLVETAASVAEARRWLAQTPPFDLLVTDLSLPDGTGVDLLRHLRAQHSLMPVVLMSGNVDNQSIPESCRLEFADIVTKPIDFDRLMALITRLLNERKAAQPVS